MSVRHFIFYDSARPTERVHVHYTNWVEALGERKPIYTEEDIKKLYPVMSATQVKRIESMRDGTSLKLHRLHKNGSLMLKCLDDDSAKLLLKKELAHAAIALCWKDIEAACPEIFENLRRIEQHARKLDAEVKNLDYSK